MFHIVFLCTKRADMTQAEFSDYWITRHTPLTAAAPGLRAYRCYPLTGHDGPHPGFDAVAVLSFNDEPAWRTAERSPEFQAALADAPAFQTTDRTFAFFAAEHVIV